MNARRHVARAHPGDPHDAGDAGCKPEHAATREADHRRGQHHAVEPAMALGGRLHQDGRAHRMGEREQRRRTVGQHDLAHEGLEIGLVFREALDVSLVAVVERTLRKPLPAPVEGRDRKAARAEIAHDLEIFFDEFGAPLKNAHRSLASGRRRPARIAQQDAVRRLQHRGRRIFGDRIGGNRDQSHCGLERRAERSVIAACCSRSTARRARAGGILALRRRPAPCDNIL